MILLEYEAKELLNKDGILIPRSSLINKDNIKLDNIKLPAVLKAQVPTGKRNKFGGIKIVKTKDDLKVAINDIFKTSINGHQATSILAEEFIDIKKEFYLSLLINREKATIEILANKAGGIDIEDLAEDSFFREIITQNNLEDISRQLGIYFELEDDSAPLAILSKLFGCFIKNDATLLEINPLILTTRGNLIVADCKMTLDDSANFRHKDWSFTVSAKNSNFVTLNPAGTIATIANGAGLAMATVDSVETSGLVATNFLDIGGGVSTEKIVECFEKIMQYKNTRGIVINIFAGITRCDDVANAIIEAKKEIANLPALFIRLEGTNLAEAQAILKKHDIQTYSSLKDIIRAIKEPSYV